jgi:twitching motility protein PilT
MSEAAGSFHSHALELALRILRGAVAAGASDVHLKAGVAPLVRIQGQLCPLEHPALPDELVDATVAALAASAGVPPERANRPQVDFSCEVPDVARFRAHAYRQKGTAALALRRVPHPIPDFAALRLPPVVKRIAHAERGLVLVAGATGMGKSTTIAAMLEYVNCNAARHVVTLEDPVEFVFEDKRSSFSQREVGRDVESMSVGLEGVWREDPDILFIGELRTIEEFDVALNAAESGRVVVSTCHAADAARTITRMISLYPPDFRDSARARLADSLQAIIGQRLVTRRGARDRLLVTEVLTQSPTVQDCIRDPARTRSISSALEAGTHEYGSHSFDQNLAGMVRDGLVAVDTAKAAATSPSDLVRSLRITR